MYLLNSACLESQIQLIRKIRFPHNLVLGYTFFFFFLFLARRRVGKERKRGRKGRKEGQDRRREGNVKMLLWGCLWYSQKEEVLV